MKAVLFLKSIVAVYFLYGALLWFESGVFLTVLPLSEVFCALLFLTASSTADYPTQKKWLLRLAGIGFLFSSEFIIELFFSQFVTTYILDQVVKYAYVIIGISVLWIFYRFLVKVYEKSFLQSIYTLLFIVTLSSILFYIEISSWFLISFIAYGQWMYVNHSIEVQNSNYTETTHVFFQSLSLVFLMDALVKLSF